MQSFLASLRSSTCKIREEELVIEGLSELFNVFQSALFTLFLHLRNKLLKFGGTWPQTGQLSINCTALCPLKKF